METTDPEHTLPPAAEVTAAAAPEPEPAVPESFPWATWGPWIAVGGAILSLIVGLVLTIPVFWASGAEDTDALGWVARSLMQLCTAIGFVAVPFFIAREFPTRANWRQAAARLGFKGFAPRNAAKWIAIGFAGYIVFAIIFAVAFGAPEQDDIAGKLGPIPVQILLIVLIAPFAEELCFRGMLFGGFRKRFNLPVAALGAGLVFGLLHYSTGISAVPQLIVLGAIFAVVYEKTGSIWPPIIFHAINNAYALAVINS
jgi:membrane protease YdiL (CAAX protease family)